MRQLLLLFCIGLIVTLSSCREDFNFESSQGDLSFSRDTIYLDTVFSNIGSSTYTLKVYNHSNKDIKIPTIKLGEGINSKYRLMVDGDGIGSGSVPGKVFSNVELLAKDSLFIFVETTIDYSEYANNETTFLYTDKIEFDSGSNYQKVELVTLVQDAIFLYPQRNDEGLYEAITISEDDDTLIYGFNLDHADNNDEYTWTNTKPYVIYGYAAVPPGETLTVQPGAHVHFHDNSGLIVKQGGTLNIGSESDAGIEENQVIFEGDRLEPDFADVPGQWLTIWMQNGSKGNLNNFTLKNATVGILAEGNDGTDESLKLRNVQIYNNSNVGILARNAHIMGDNVVINNAGQAGLGCTYGGRYRFRHCTFANYFNSYNQVPVLVTDYIQAQDNAGMVQTYFMGVDARFDNCITYGSGNYGILYDRQGDSSTAFDVTLNHCLIKFSDYSQQFQNDPLYQFDNTGTVNYTGCLITTTSAANNPAFFDPDNNDLEILKDESAAQGQADAAVSGQVPFDITNISRTTDPDIGAYESREAPDE